MDVNKKILQEFNHVSQEEYKELMNIFLLSRRKPEIKLCIAMFREIFMFRTMVNALVSSYETRIKELEDMVEQLEADNPTNH